MASVFRTRFRSVRLRSPGGARRNTAAIAGLFVAVMLAGCVVGEGEPAESAERQRMDATSEVLWRSGDQLMSRIVRVDGVVLAYVADGGQMHLIARDAMTGEEAWREPALFGMGSSGVVASVSTLERDGRTYAAYYASDGGGPGALRVIDVDSGEHLDRDRTQPIYADRPETCGDSFCATGSWWYDGAERPWSDRTGVVFDWDSGAWKSRRTSELPMPLVSEDAVRLGKQLSVSKSRGAGQERLGYGADGVLVWSRPYEEIFADGFSSDYGWAWAVDESRPLLGTGVGGRTTTSNGGRDTTTVDLPASSKTVRLSRETGETIWEAEGVSMRCDQSWRSHGGPDNVLVLCGFSAGKVVATETADGESTAEEGTQAFVAGLDMETGDELWRVDTAEAWDGETSSRHIVPGGDHIHIEKPGGIFSAIDISSGEEGALAGAFGPAVLCAAARGEVEVRRFSAAGHVWSTGDDKVTPSTEDAVFTCGREDLKDVDTPPKLSELRRIGYAADDVAVLGGRDGMVAYGLPRPPAEANAAGAP